MNLLPVVPRKVAGWFNPEYHATEGLYDKIQGLSQAIAEQYLKHEDEQIMKGSSE